MYPRIETLYSSIDGWEWFVIDGVTNECLAAGTGYHNEDCKWRAERWIRENRVTI